MLWYPSSLDEALCVEVDSSAGDDYFEGMVQANAAAVDWVSGRIDTETYFQSIEYWLEEPEPIEFVNDTLRLYLPGIDLL